MIYTINSIILQWIPRFTPKYIFRSGKKQTYKHVYKNVLLVDKLETAYSFKSRDTNTELFICGL